LRADFVEFGGTNFGIAIGFGTDAKCNGAVGGTFEYLFLVVFFVDFKTHLTIFLCGSSILESTAFGTE